MTACIQRHAIPRRAVPFQGACVVIAVLAVGTPLAAVELDSIQIHGFISQGYYRTTQTDWYGSSQDAGSFAFNEAAINASAQPLDSLRLGVQLLARDFGDSGNNRIEIDWAFADWRAAARSGLKVGRFKMPYGLYNESRDLDFDHPTVFLPEVIYLPQLRDYTLALNGAMVYSGVDLGGAGQVDGCLFVGGQNLREEGDLANYLTDLNGGDSFSSISLDYIFGSTVTWQTPLDGLRLRASGAGFKGFEAVGRAEGSDVPGQPGVYADLDITTTVGTFLSGILSAEYQREGLTMAFEYLREYGRSEIDIVSQPFTYIPGALPGSTIRLNLPASQVHSTTYSLGEAMYGSASYRLFDRIELSVTRQVRFSNRNHPGSRFDRSWCFAGRYDIFSNWLVKAEWQYHDGYELDTGRDFPESWSLFALKTTVDF